MSYAYNCECYCDDCAEDIKDSIKSDLGDEFVPALFSRAVQQIPKHHLFFFLTTSLQVRRD